jgi:hypothetical protein
MKYIWAPLVFSALLLAGLWICVGLYAIKNKIFGEQYLNEDMFRTATDMWPLVVIAGVIFGLIGATGVKNDQR